MENPNIDSEEREQDAAEEALADSQEGKNDSRPWYPYITKAQFEKFLARLQSRIPDEIDRDYIRAIIRTPSMIHRFLRGIEAMKLIDGDQKPTDRLQKLVNQDTRAGAVDEILEDLYPELLKEYRANGEMADRDIVSFFRKETGMGNDSANKMKMFFKYLISCTDSDGEASSEGGGNGSPAASAPPAPPVAATGRQGARRQGARRAGARGTGARIELEIRATVPRTGVFGRRVERGLAHSERGATRLSRHPESSAEGQYRRGLGRRHDQARLRPPGASVRPGPQGLTETAIGASSTEKGPHQTVGAFSFSRLTGFCQLRCQTPYL